MRERFRCSIGLSDHSLGIGASVCAVALGARLIEKHITLSRKIETPDSFFSIEPDELKELVENVRIAEKALGNVHYGSTRGEKQNKVFRRSLFVVQDIRAGQAFSEENVRSIRPGFGLSPKFLEIILGKTAGKAIKRGTPLSWELIDQNVRNTPQLSTK